MKHFFPILLALALLLSFTACGKSNSAPSSVPEQPTAAEPTFAPEPSPASDPEPRQLCGKGLEWDFADGTLTISGQGPMDDFELLEAPWDVTGTSLSVKKLVVEEGVTYLGSNAFAACCNLSSVTLPSTLLSIGESAFADCMELTAVALPEALLSVDSFAFAGSGLASLSLPSQLARIGDFAFSNCTALKELTVPGSLLSLGTDAFLGCDGLVSVAVPGGSSAETLLRDTGLDEKLTLSAPVAAPVWEGTDGTLHWRLASGVLTLSGTDTIPDYSASGFDAAPWAPMLAGVEKLLLPDGLTRIGTYAFWNCTALRSVALPDTLTEIGDYAFGACEKLETLSLPGSLRSIGVCSFSFCQSLTEIVLPDSLETIGEDAFRMCVAVRSVTAPGTIRTVGQGAFGFGCQEAPEINAPAGSPAAKALEDAFPAA